MPKSALDQAVLIARSAAGEAIDWGREPLTERESLMRSLWIVRRFETLIGGQVIRRKVTLLRRSGRYVPFDLREAEEIVALDLQHWNAADQREEWKVIREEIDASRSGQNGTDDADDDEEIPA